MFGKKQNVVTALTHETADILGVFTNTINGLTDVAERAEVEAQNKRAEAEKLLSDAGELALIAGKNQRIADKLRATLDWES